MLHVCFNACVCCRAPLAAISHPRDFQYCISLLGQRTYSQAQACLQFATAHEIGVTKKAVIKYPMAMTLRFRAGLALPGPTATASLPPSHILDRGRGVQRGKCRKLWIESLEACSFFDSKGCDCRLRPSSDIPDKCISFLCIKFSERTGCGAVGVGGCKTPPPHPLSLALPCHAKSCTCYWQQFFVLSPRRLICQLSFRPYLRASKASGRDPKEMSFCPYLRTSTSARVNAGLAPTPP